MKIELGTAYPQEVELAEQNIRELLAKRDTTDLPPDVKWFDISVAVFVNGKIQWHAGTVVGSQEPPDRSMVKCIAGTILRDFDPKGKVTV